MRLALVQDGIVVNVVEADEGFSPDNGLLAIPSAEAGPGWRYDGKTLAPPHEKLTTPKCVSMFQAREAMRRFPTRDGGCLLDTVNRYIDQRRLEQPTLALAWEYAVDIARDGVFVQTLAGAFGLDDAALDELFRLAATIHA